MQKKNTYWSEVRRNIDSIYPTAMADIGASYIKHARRCKDCGLMSPICDEGRQLWPGDRPIKDRLAEIENSFISQLSRIHDVKKAKQHRNRERKKTDQFATTHFDPPEHPPSAIFVLARLQQSRFVKRLHSKYRATYLAVEASTLDYTPGTRNVRDAGRYSDLYEPLKLIVSSRRRHLSDNPIDDNITRAREEELLESGQQLPIDAFLD